MRIRYYSQSGEDALLWSVFAGKTNGFFIEVGAFDGKHLSNSLSFEEVGWRGICVEPLQQYFDLCVINRPNTICVRAACVGPDEPETVEFYSEPLGLLSGINAVETKNMDERYAARGMEFSGFEKISVPAKTIDQILFENKLSNQDIDFVSLDTEGNELDVLAGMAASPKVVLCEANTGDSLKGLMHIMSDRGYVLARKLGHNLFFTNEADKAAQLREAHFEVTTERTEHPLGAAVTHPLHLTRTICVESEQ